MKPARTSSLCDTTCASAGASLSVGMNSWLNRATVDGMARRYTPVGGRNDGTGYSGARRDPRTEEDESMWRQGDILIQQVDAIPEHATVLPHLILAESEA